MHTMYLTEYLTYRKNTCYNFSCYYYYCSVLIDSISLSEANLLKEIQYYSGDFSPKPVEVSTSYFPLNYNK